MLPAAILGAWIAIVISGASPSDEERDELLRACSEAIAGRCTLSGEAEKSATPPDALAVLSLDSHLSRARAELGRTGRAWKQRDLTFAEADSRTERWRALGLTLATLFGGPIPETPTSAPPTPAARRARPPRGSPVPDVTSPDAGSPEAPGLVRLGAAVSTAPALTQGPLRWGAVLRVSVGPLADIVEPTAAVGYGFRPGSSRGLDVRFLTLSVGLAVPYAPAGLFVLRPRFEVAGEWISVSQSAPPDSGSRLLAGTLVGLEADWPARSPLAAFVSGELWMFTGATAIHAGGERIGSIASRRWAASTGILLELD